MENEIENSWKELITSFISFHPTYHIIFEIGLILSGLFLYFSRSYKPVETNKLTKKEEEDLITEWKPEPLVPDDWVPNKVIQSKFERSVVSSFGKIVYFEENKTKPVLNLASFNFFNLIGNEKINESAQKALRKYGVGSCGPRGFYGTFDVHLKLEDEIANFMNCEESVVYSYGFSTVASAIPAYAKRGDVIFADEGVSFAIQCGLIASRSKIKYFKHNDIDHLTDLLEKQTDEAIKNPAKARITRTFIVVEGLYINYGDICPLAKIVELKYKYKVRIFLDETLSFGVLGEYGRGITEHFGVDVTDIDLITGSLETALATCGGFSVGSKYVVDHQRLSGQGYCFSASLPPLLACGASVVLEIIKTEEGVANRMRLNEISNKISDIFDSRLAKYWVIKSERISPVKHVRLINNNTDEQLEKAINLAYEKGLLITVARYLKEAEYKCPEPSIRISINCALTDEEIDFFCDIMENIGEQLSIGGIPH